MANAHENRHNAWRLLAVTADTRTCVFLQLPSLQLAHAHKYRASHSFPSGTSQLPVNTCTFLVYVCCHSFAYAGTPSLENADVACDNHDLAVVEAPCWNIPVHRPISSVLLPTLQPAAPTTMAFRSQPLQPDRKLTNAIR